MNATTQGLGALFPANASNTTTAPEEDGAGGDEDQSGGACYTVVDAVAQYFLYSQVDWVLTMVIMPIILVVGVVGNAAVIYAFLRVKSLRTTTNYYLISLAVADLAYLCLAIPYTILQFSHSPVPNDASLLGQAGCKATNFLVDSLLLASCFLIIVVSFERYLAICWPMQFRVVRKNSYVALTCLGCWLLAALGKSPTAALTYSQSFCLYWDISNSPSYLPSQVSYCYYCEPETYSCTVYSHIDQLTYLLAIPFLTVLYLLIVVELKRGQETSISMHGSSLSRNKQVVRMLLITVLVYVVCVAPFRIVNLLRIHGQLGVDTVSTLTQAARMAAHINAAANPIIYNLTSKSYRRSFRKAFPLSLTKRGAPGTNSIHPHILMEGRGSSTRKGLDPDNGQTQPTNLE